MYSQLQVVVLLQLDELKLELHNTGDPVDIIGNGRLKITSTITGS